MASTTQPPRNAQQRAVNHGGVSGGGRPLPKAIRIMRYSLRFGHHAQPPCYPRRLREPTGRHVGQNDPDARGCWFNAEHQPTPPEIPTATPPARRGSRASPARSSALRSICSPSPTRWAARMETASGPLAPVFRGEGGGEGWCAGRCGSGVRAFHPSPQPSPLSTGARGQSGEGIIATNKRCTRCHDTPLWVLAA
jgi:hypothetical protein